MHWVVILYINKEGRLIKGLLIKREDELKTLKSKI